MTADDGFIDAILAAPDDDAPRAAYAAHLRARKDPRGEFIELQLERAKNPKDDALRKREDAILAEHQDAWLAPFGGGVIGVWRRGFPACFVSSGEKFLDARPIIARLPLESLTLVCDLKSTIEQIALSPELARFTEIELSAGEPHEKWAAGDQAFAAFVRSPHLRRVRAFTTGWNDLGGAALDALANAPWLSRLTKLVVRNNPLAPDAVARIAPRLSNLEWLDFSSSLSADVGAAAIAAAQFPRLEWLRLSSSRITREGASAIANGHFGALQTLVLGDDNVGDEGAAAIASSRALSTLTELRLPGACIGPAGGKSLAASKTLSALRDLDVSSNQLEGDGVDAFARSRALRSLERLTISYNVYTGEIEEWYDQGAVVGSGPKRESHAALLARFAKRPELKIA